MLALQEYRRELVRFGRWLYRKGFMPGTSGNLSVRLEDGTILATPTGCSKYLMRAADMVIVDLDGRQISGTRKVTSEIGMHLAVYRARHDIRAVVHAHPPIATGFACAGRALDEPLCAEAVMTLGPVPLAPYATTGTDALAQSLAALIPHHSAILMANHGAVAYGENLLDAFLKMETVEHFANICLVAHQLGSARPLQQLAIDDLLQAKERYVQNALAKMH
ncbi:MAG: class II aldolase/adducin family protein [Edaphobacter sp.]|uniref:class II aldolase/adducin family protein n=1 Tax=Edaphobacter sp. TaxID=1934404 RepID=UPI002392449A|nr:class II aldolase/adducin family protein [Edaphobacter sp.]MDE1176943.1 class II aldolase/adducin family protein [Edaphobacter sp.]